MEQENLSGFTIPTSTREEVMAMLQKDPEVFDIFLHLSSSMREELLAFCMGNKGLKITYDPVFKEILSPQYHRERLEYMLSCFLKEKITIREILPNESRRLAADASLVIMDILVERASGGLINLEIQKIGFDFPGQRCACYSSDLVMREYARVKSRKKKHFSYRNMKKVVTIVLIENSGAAFHQTGDFYLHHFRQTSDTGLSLDLLQEYIFITLDVFREIAHNIDTELDAWMYFLSSDEPSDILRLTERYPYFKDLYRDILSFQQKPEELVNMFSKALAIMDRNTIQYMIEDRDRKIKEMERTIKEQEWKAKEQERKVKEQERKVKEQAMENARLQEELAGLKRETVSQLTD